MAFDRLRFQRAQNDAHRGMDLSVFWRKHRDTFLDALDLVLRASEPEPQQVQCKIHNDDIRLLVDNEIFVFGSNLAGIHGAGAAKMAYERFGAIWGKGLGSQGASYALPTKDRDLRTLPLAIIQLHVNALRTVIEKHPLNHYLITKVGCGLAGYTEQQVAPLFKEFLSLSNCSLPQEFVNICSSLR